MSKDYEVLTVDRRVRDYGVTLVPYDETIHQYCYPNGYPSYERAMLGAVDSGVAGALVGYWRFDEAGTAGVAVANDVLVRQNGNYYGAVQLGQAGALFLDPSTGAKFDGVSGFADFGTHQSWDAPSETTGYAALRTIMFWFRDDDRTTASDKILVGKMNTAATRGWEILYRPSTGTVKVRMGGVSAIGTTGTYGNLRDGAWHHVSITLNGTGVVTFQFDGGSVSTDSTIGTLGVTAHSESLRCARSGGYAATYMACSLKDLAIFFNVFAAAAVATFYAVGRIEPRILPRDSFTDATRQFNPGNTTSIQVNGINTGTVVVASPKTALIEVILSNVETVSASARGTFEKFETIVGAVTAKQAVETSDGATSYVESIVKAPGGNWYQTVFVKPPAFVLNRVLKLRAVISAKAPDANNPTFSPVLVRNGQIYFPTIGSELSQGGTGAFLTFYGTWRLDPSTGKQWRYEDLLNTQVGLCHETTDKRLQVSFIGAEITSSWETPPGFGFCNFYRQTTGDPAPTDDTAAYATGVPTLTWGAARPVNGTYDEWARVYDVLGRCVAVVGPRTVTYS